MVSNVLFITADHFRGDCLGCAGHPCIRTPHLDDLAKQGLRFKRHYANAVPCAPSRACIHTGMYMANHRVIDNGVPLSSSITNWALEISKSTTVQPAVIGYTDQAPDPRALPADDPKLQRWDGGFMEGFHNLSEKNMLGSPQWLDKTGISARLGKAMDRIREPGFVSWNGWQGDLDWMEVARDTGARVDAPPSSEGNVAPAAYMSTESDTFFLTNQAIDYIRLQAKQKKPWALHLSLLKPHPPFLAPEPYNKAYHPSNVDLPRNYATSAAYERSLHPYLNAVHAEGTLRPLVTNETGSVAELREDEIRQFRAAYYGLISEVDDNIGRLLAALRACGEDSNTLIIFTSDHGELLGDHWLRGKLGFHDEAYHVPFLLRDPTSAADISRGGCVDTFTEHVDLGPTVLDYLGVSLPASFDGNSLRSFATSVDGAPQCWRKAVHFEYDFRYRAPGTSLRKSHGLGMRDCVLTVFRTETRKLVHFGGGLPPLLFDLAADAGELVNVAEDPAYAAELTALLLELINWRTSHLPHDITHVVIRNQVPPLPRCSNKETSSNSSARARSRTPPAVTSL